MIIISFLRLMSSAWIEALRQYEKTLRRYPHLRPYE
jgi:hypothetical protein